jgi:hypothetical protein
LLNTTTNSWTYASAQPTNGQVCRTGAFSFLDARFPPCGQIKSVDHWEWSCAGQGTTTPCAAIDHEWRVDIDTTGGDSGGPYYSPPNINNEVSLYGIVTHSVNDTTCFNDRSKCRAWYTPTSWIVAGLSSELGITVSWFCIASDCHQPICFTWGCGQ